MPTDLDRRCLAQQRDLEQRIDRLDRLIKRTVRRNRWSRAGRLTLARNEALIELHEMRQAHDAYDRRLAEAMDDPTGQDLDLFQYSE